MINIVRDKTRLSLELLELFVAVVQHESISAAARIWNISPSLATRKVAALEAELNAHLLDRTTRRIHLTEAGRVTLTWAKKVISGHSQLSDELAVLQQKLSGTLRVVSNEYLLTAVLPDFLSTFSSKFPEIRFVLTMTDSVVSNEKRDYDVAIHSGQIPDSTLKGIRIRNFQRVLCASPEYLKRRGVPERIQALLEHDCLTHQQAAEGYWTFRKDKRVVKQKLNPTVLSSSHLPLIALAKNGMGIVQISRGSIRKELGSGELVTLLDDYECVNQDGTRPATWVIFPGERELTRTQVFISELTKYLRNVSE
ncbi:MAG: hypothetical protein JWR21_1126 [Herminiimonas sp.]|nr:hypothetical protein [Herminiimonas sp.]